MTAVLAALLLACAAVLLQRGPARQPAARAAPVPRSPAVACAGLLLLTGAAGGRQVLVVTVIATLAGVAGLRLWRRRTRGRAVAATRERVVELCEALQVELGAGQTPATALGLAAAEWDALEPAARTARSGGDVPTALRELATAPGAADLRVVAAAWQVAHRTGHGLADAVGRVAAELRAAEQTRRVVAGELASARATARLVASLPVAALVLGSGAGSDPWGFLVGQPLGWACLASGLGFGLAGLAWIEAIAGELERDR